MSDIFRIGYWPGPKPDISPDRTMCSDCVFHSAAIAGWQFDRCRHQKADLGSVVRNSEIPTCHEIRNSNKQCGPSGKWFKQRPKNIPREHSCVKCSAEAIEPIPIDETDELKTLCHACGDERHFKWEWHGGQAIMVEMEQKEG